MVLTELIFDSSCSRLRCFTVYKNIEAGKTPSKNEPSHTKVALELRRLETWKKLLALLAWFELFGDNIHHL